MTYENFKSKLDRYIEENTELVEEYNQMSTVPLNSLTYELYRAVESVRDRSKMSVNSIMNHIMPIAIAEHRNILEAVEDIFDTDFKKDTKKSPLQIYFDDVKNTYDKNGNEYDIEYCEENREKLIEMNLKSVISIAKKFKGLGLPMEDLIGAGNYGLCVAFDKFDPNRSKIKTTLLDALDSCDETIEYEKLTDVMSPLFAYGKPGKKFLAEFKKGEAQKKSKVVSWVKKNVTNARFNSVAVMWIKAYIMIEIDNNSRIIKKSKSDIKEEKTNGKDIYINIDSQVGDSGNNTVADVLLVDDGTADTYETLEAQDIFKEGMSVLLTGVKVRNRRILLQRFGIGYPRAMTPKEIAQLEGLSVARVSQIVQSTLKKMKENQEKYNVDEQLLFNAVKNIY